MPHYCDAKVLEHNWFLWITATAVPSLEKYRKAGVLWTKPLATVESKGKLLPDPSSRLRMHCLNLATPLYFQSDAGQPGVVYARKYRSADIRKLPTFYKPAGAASEFADEGFYREQPEKVCWDAMLGDISQMCFGIAGRTFKQIDEHRHDLAYEALQQVASKLRRGRLVYTPGRASVFNLLTTTIHRCMYSITSKNGRQRQHTAKLIEDICQGHVASLGQHSLRVAICPE